MATKKSTSQATSQSTSQEFFYTPVGNITVFEQVRSNIDIEKDSFKSLMQSIKDKGILEPLLVTGPEGGPYTLLCGERRLVAAQQLGFELAPVRVIDAGTNNGKPPACCNPRGRLVPLKSVGRAWVPG